jgi:hypothetical protein
VKRALPGWVALLPAGLALGSGPLNGDVAAYLTSPVTDRWVHVPYAALARAVGAVGLDLTSVVASAVIVALAARRSSLAGLGAAAVLLPFAPFAEVDLPWVALAWAAVEVHPWFLGLAVAVSPSALLAAPWVVARTGRWDAVLAAAAAVAVLTAASGGLWWTGERGVLHAGPLLVGRGLGLWLAHLPWFVLLAAPRSGAGLAWGLPLALAPTDTPLWLLPALAVVADAEPSRWVRLAVAAHWLGALLALGDRAARVRGENEVVATLASRWQPGDGLIAPWTWGARVAVAVSGDVYGVPWHPPGRWLRDQEAVWCRDEPARVHHLPPQAAAQETRCR